MYKYIIKKSIYLILVLDKYVPDYNENKETMLAYKSGLMKVLNVSYKYFRTVRKYLPTHFEYCRVICAQNEYTYRYIWRKYTSGVLEFKNNNEFAILLESCDKLINNHN